MEPANSFITIDYINQLTMIASIEELIIEIDNQRSTKATAAPTKTRWNRKEQALFEQLAARFGSDYKLLGSFLPRKTEKQLRKRYRYMLRYRRERLEKMEQEILTAHRKEFFDQSFLQETDSSSSANVGSRSPDLCSQSLP